MFVTLSYDFPMSVPVHMKLELKEASSVEYALNLHLTNVTRRTSTDPLCFFRGGGG